MEILVAGLPKTGTTALLYLLAENLGDAGVIFEPSDYAAVQKQQQATEPSPLSAKLKLRANRLLKRPLSLQRVYGTAPIWLTKVVYATHDQRSLTTFMEEFAVTPRLIWLARDPRDQIISAFLYAWFRAHQLEEHYYLHALEQVQRKEQGESVSLVSILRATLAPRFYWGPEYYQQRIVPFWRDHAPKDGLIYPYTDLVDRRYDKLREYLGHPIQGDAQVPDQLKRVVRTKGYGSWRVWFEPEDVDFFRPILKEYMDLMQIPDDWELSEDTPDPKFGSQYMQKLRQGG